MDTEINSWSNVLGRNLSELEKELFYAYESELLINDKIKQLNTIIKDRNLEISKLTENSGNCMFESLIHCGIGKSIHNLRKSIAYLMLIFKDYKGFFEGQNETLKEIFTTINDIELVHSREKEKDNSKEIISKIYKYTYEVMCNDLACNCNWQRLPTELILMFISKIYNINISIISDTGYEHSITTNQSNSPKKTVYLAHIDEIHYLPISDTITGINLAYTDIKTQFDKWMSNNSVCMNYNYGSNNIEEMDE